MPSLLLISAILAFIVGTAAWVGGYSFYSKKMSKYNPLRGLPCIPGLVLVLLSLIMFGFFWHWVVGTLVIVGIGYAGWRLIVAN